MNNEQRDNLEEQKLAEETLRVLDGQQCVTEQDSRTFELGRLLRQSASHDLPEADDELRQMLLDELEGEAAVPVASTKTLAPKPIDRIRRRRMWMALPTAGLMIVVGGWWLYPDGLMKVAEHDARLELADLEARAERALNRNKSELRDEAVVDVGGDGLPDRDAGDNAQSFGFNYEIKERNPGDPSINAGGSVESAGQSTPSDVKLPKLSVTTKNTVISVPDGGTVFSGGLKLGQVGDEPFGLRPGNDQQGEQSVQGQQGEGQGQGQNSDGPAPYSELGFALQNGDSQQGGQPEQGQQGKQSVQGQQAEGKGQGKSDGQGQGQPGQQGQSSGDASRRGYVQPSELGFGNQNGDSQPGDLQPGLPAGDRELGNGIDIVSNGVRGRSDRGKYKSRVKGELSSEYKSGTNGKNERRIPNLKKRALLGPLFGQQQGELSGKRPESQRREQYAPIYENQFVQAAGAAAVSTFSIDVDTASYANMRRFLNSGQMPPRDSVRIEELVNYFQYDYPQPQGDDPFSVNMELATCPWNDTHKLLRVGLKGKEIHVKERPATNVVYLIDVSGSMNSKDKLPLLKRGFQMMTKQLGENDRVSIVTYAGNAGVALEPTTGDKTRTINEAIERLSSGGSTHGSAGIELAYKLAQQHFITGGVNKVILATDGDLNVGVTDDDSLVKLIKQKASEGVFLTVLGFGTGNLQDGKLEKLADNGNGHYAYLDSNREAHRVLVQQLSGSLVTIAKDVKIQIEFNPAEVKSYRLIGYENRMLATKDFDDDRKDAGEIGAGHTVTAIYEIEPINAVAAAFTAPAGMKYQLPGAAVLPQQGEGKLSRQLSEAASSGELATLALRYKKPDENDSKRIEFAIKNEDKSFGSASDDFRFAASVAGFGMLLRESEHAGVSTPAMVFKMASDSIGDDASGYRAEFLDLVRKSVPQDDLLEAEFYHADQVTIALGGFFDLDGDGVSDLEQLKRMIARNGGRVVVWHDENGNVTGKIDATTRCFVLGPSPRSGNREVFETMAKLKEQAEASSVDIIDLPKLLNWMGIQGKGSSKIERFDARSPARK